MNTKWIRRIVFVLTAVLAASTALVANPKSQDNVWTPVDKGQLRQPGIDAPAMPTAFQTFQLNKAALQAALNRAPEEYSGKQKIVLSLPMPDGTFGRFMIEHSLVVEPGLLVKYPELGATYRGQGIDDPTATVRFDFLPSGFHSMILSSRGSILVNPYMDGDRDNYISFYKDDEPNRPVFECQVGKEDFGSIMKTKDPDVSFLPDMVVPEVTSGTTLRTYRLALAADNEYCVAVGANTVAGSLAAQVLIMNRVNGVYERDLSIHMNMVANNNLIVYAADNLSCGGACTSANDPYTNTNPTGLLTENQNNLTTVIGSANYDLGHVFTTGGGGVAGLGVACSAGSKARGETGLPNPVGDGYAIDFVAHEMGHQWGGNHTFNGNTDNCSGGNRAGNAAYEPGSGITIMAYAGICGTQDLAPHSIDTFHVKSLEEIVQYSQVGNGNSCAVATPTLNTPPAVPTVGGPFNIPKQTPFALTASTTDVNGDTISYDWEEYDLGAATVAVPNTDATQGAMPIFRPYSPVPSGTRFFPSLPFILNNANVPPSTTGGFLTGELLPAITRTMSFQVVARDNHAGGGGINTATATVNVDGNSGPFVVTAPNTNVTYGGNSSQVVTWNVANTTAAPVGAANVKISLSTDGGLTFPTTLMASTPNDGSQVVTMPIVNTTTARIKIEGVGNIFFDVSDVNFSITGFAAPPKSRGDFDGDGKSDVSVFRPSDGNWYLNRSTAGNIQQIWGLSGDVPTPGDFDNDGKADLSVWRPGAAGAFYVFLSATNTVTGASWGTTNDIPVVGDYDGDGKSDYSVWRSTDHTWYTIKSTGGSTITSFGATGDTPMAADFDGDGKTDLTTYRASTSTWTNTLSGGGSQTFPFGAVGDMPVPADYNGDGKDEFALFRPSNGTWYIIDPQVGGIRTVAWGLSGDVPVPGDYDGDGLDDVAVFRSGTWYMNRSTAGFTQLPYGLATDIPILKKYIP